MKTLHNLALFWCRVIGPSFSDAGTTSLEGRPLEMKDNYNAELMPWMGNKWVFSVWRLLHSLHVKKPSLQQPMIEMDVDGPMQGQIIRSYPIISL